MDTFILNSELKLRNYINNYSDEIMKIILFEDSLDNIVYFYCYTKKILLTTKDYLSFDYYYNIYTKIYKKLNFNTFISNNKVLKLIK